MRTDTKATTYRLMIPLKIYEMKKSRYIIEIHFYSITTYVSLNFFNSPDTSMMTEMIR